MKLIYFFCLTSWISSSALAAPWALHGKLYNSRSTAGPVYVVINEGIIQEVVRAKPAGMPIVKTRHWIAPGLIDLHGHLKYNVLGLWDRAQGQFLNRFEWAGRFPPYKQAVSRAMSQIRGAAICDAVRWAELKALSAGVTTVQGVGADGACTAGFGARNIEVAGDLGEPGRRSRAATFIVEPDMVGRVYEGMLRPLMTERSLDYTQALDLIVQSAGISAWVERFNVLEERNLATGIELMLGESLGASRATGDAAPAAFERLVPRLRNHLEERLSAGAAGMVAVPQTRLAAEVEEQIVSMREWLFGGGSLKGYLLMSAAGPVRDYISNSAVIALPRLLTRYYGVTEPVRASLVASLEAGDSLGVFGHLAEGRRDDPYNRAEFQYAREMGLVREGMAFIHGTGMSAQDFERAARANVSIVWSPFSNLLLYGETTDVKTAIDAGVNVALGSDWSPTGSKNLLDEVRMARRYLDSVRARGVNDAKLVEMVMTNPARALKRDGSMGAIQANALADLVLIRKARGAKSFAKTLLATDQEAIDLVIIKGKVRWGAPALVEDALAKSGQAADAEIEAITAAGDCGFEKSYVVDDATTVASLKGRLEPKLARLDPIFSCEDAAYATRVAAFVTEEVPANLARRAELRASANLEDTWSPLGTPVALDSLGLHLHE